MLCTVEQLRIMLTGNHIGSTWRLWSVHCESVQRWGSDNMQRVASSWTR